MTRVGLMAALLLGSAGAAAAADARYPDWPCQQLKVPQLSAAAIWAGPPINDVGTRWRDDPQIADLVPRLAARRTPMNDAEKLANDFVAALPGDKQAKATLLFAGVFTTLDGERTTVMNGIERFTRKQKEFADKIRGETEEMRTLQDAKGTAPAKLDELGESIAWDTRIFEERRKTIGFVCEVPVLIERRLGALARAIQQAME